jgi:hypothetical protein
VVVKETAKMECALQEFNVTFAGTAATGFLEAKDKSKKK